MTTDDKNLRRHDGTVHRADREALLGQRGGVVWFTGLSGSGKSTVARTVEARLAAAGRLVYVLDGVLRYTVDGVTRDLQRGDSMVTPRGSVHAFSNPHAQPARALVVLTPDIGAQYFRDVAAVIGAGGPPDRARLVAVMASYGLVPAPPPAPRPPG